MTGAQKALIVMKRRYPGIYKRLRRHRPDLIREANARELNGMGAVDGVLDDILDFGSKAMPLYQSQQKFKSELKAATKQPPTVVMATPAKDNTMLYVGIASVIGLTATLFFMRKKGRR